MFGCGEFAMEGCSKACSECAPNIDTTHGIVTDVDVRDGSENDDDNDENEESVGTYRAAPLQTELSFLWCTLIM